MPASDILANIASNYAQKGIDKIALFWKNKQFNADIQDYFCRYQSSIFENIDRECEFDFGGVREKIENELLPELVLSRSAPHLQQRKKARISFLNACYAYSAARTIKQQQAVHRFVEPIYGIIDEYLQNSQKDSIAYATANAVDDFEEIIKDCITTLGSDIASIKQDLEISINYSGSFAEFIDQIAPKPQLHVPFHYLNPRISFFGRTKELQTLESFLFDPDPIRVCVVSGVGGSGKSKLVYEFVNLHSFDVNWKFVYIQPERFEKILDFNRWEYDLNLTIIIDYAGRVSEKIGLWLKTLCATVYPSRPNKLRLILLERQGTRFDISNRLVFPHWYQELIGTGEQKYTVSPLIYQQDFDNYFVTLDPLNNSDTRKLVESYSDSQFVPLKKTDIATIMNRLDRISSASPQMKIPLFVLFITDAYINGSNIRRWNANSILEFIVDRLSNNLLVTICHGNKQLFHAVFQTLIFSTAANNWEIGTTLPQPFQAASDHLNNLDPSSLCLLVDEINNANYETNKINAIEPDIIGEFLVLNYAKQNFRHCPEIFMSFWQNSDKFLSFIRNAIGDFGNSDYFSILFDSDLSWLLSDLTIDGVKEVRFELWLELILVSNFRRAVKILALMLENLTIPNVCFKDLIVYSRAVNYSLEAFTHNASINWIEELTGSLVAIYNTLYEEPSIRLIDLLPFVSFYIITLQTLIQIYDEYGLNDKIVTLVDHLSILSYRYKDLPIEQIISEAEELLAVYNTCGSDDDIVLYSAEMDFIDIHPALKIPDSSTIKDSQGCAVEPAEWYLYGIDIAREAAYYDSFFGQHQDYERFFDHHVSYYAYSGNPVYYIDEDNSNVFFTLNLASNEVDIVSSDGEFIDLCEAESFEIDLHDSVVTFEDIENSELI